MVASKTYKTEAIVLRHINLGEADRILTLYTANYGKVRAVAKGVRKTKSKIGGHVEPLTHCTVVISKGRNLDILSQSQTVESFLPLKRDLWRMAQALYVAEMTDAFSYEKMENYPVYDLLLTTLHRLVSSENEEMLFRYFEMQLIGHLGYRPELICCIACQKELTPTDNFFSLSGGVLCPDCTHTEPFVLPLSLNALKMLRLFQRGDWPTASRLKLNAELSGVLRQILQGYVRHLLEKDLKSTVFLDRLKKDCPMDILA